MRFDAEARLHRIFVRSSEIAEIVGGQRLVSVPRAQIRKLRIVRSAGAEAPVLQVVLGIAATMSGLCALLYLIDPSFFGGDGATRFVRIPALVLGFLVVGPGMIFVALRRRVVLFVDTARSTRKLGFGAKVNPEELAQFAEHVRALGIDVELDEGFPRARVRGRSAGSS